MPIKAARHLRRNVVAYLALFVALGGSAYAVTQLDRNSVRSKHIAKNQVKGSDVRESSLAAVPEADAVTGVSRCERDGVVRVEQTAADVFTEEVCTMGSFTITATCGGISNSSTLGSVFVSATATKWFAGSSQPGLTPSSTLGSSSSATVFAVNDGDAVGGTSGPAASFHAGVHGADGSKITGVAGGTVEHTPGAFAGACSFVIGATT